MAPIGYVLAWIVRWHKFRRHETGLFYCHHEPCSSVIQRIYGPDYGRGYRP